MSTEPVSLDLDRRSFMKASALAGVAALGGGTAGQVLAQNDDEVDGQDTEGELTKTICNYCSVGCGFHGERKGDSFVGMEPWEDHPINNGSLCSKGAGIYETEHSEKRLKHPMIREDGEWQKLSWDTAYDRLATDIRALWPDSDVSPSDAVDVDEEHSRESVMLLGSAHHSNEESYAIRKLAAFMGTNNIDHQARICHSTTVAGLANTWGYGAMTNTVPDYRNFDLNIIVGQNPAEAHPIAMQHILEGQKRGGTILVLDPRFTKTAAHADEFVRFRPGTDVALMMGVIKELRDEYGLAMDPTADDTGQNMLTDRVQGWEDVDAELDQYDKETVSDITWVAEEDIELIAELVHENRPQVQIEWAMGGTQHNNGTQNIRSYAALSLASGSSARSGGGLQVMRGHANVQGATDLAVASHILPGYYGLTPGGWSWWAEIWDKNPYTSGSTSFGDMYDRFELMPPDKYVRQHPVYEGNDEADLPANRDDPGHSPEEPAENSMMFQNGLTVARWFEGALDQEDRYQETPIYQPDQVKIAVFWGHSANSISEMEQMKEGMENLDLLVVIDVFPSVASVLPDYEDGPPVLLLPASSQYEHYRSLTNTNRSVQWSEPVAKPAHNSRPDLRIMQELADALGFGEHFDWGSGPEIYNGKSTYENVIREFNLGTNTIGYRQTPERLQQHLEYDYAFSSEDLKGAEGTPVEGEYWMLPWPCWGEGHPGTPIIWNDDMNPNDGGQDFRTRWGVQAPTPEEWDAMPTDADYPLQETVDAVGDRYDSQADALSLVRDPYVPDWASDRELAADGQIHGVPEYPGWKTTPPKSLIDPTRRTQSDELTIPQQYALDSQESVYTAAQAIDSPDTGSVTFDEYLERTKDVDPSFYEQYDYSQPDAPTGRGRARAVVWSFLDKVPVHREPIESPRPDLVEEWPANGQQRNFYRLDQNNAVEQQEAMDIIHGESDGPELDTIMTTGRQVEHQGGGSETRSNIHTADLQPHMYAEITPAKAEEIGVDGGDLVVVSSTDRGSVLVKARVTDRPNDGEVFLPFHWGGVFKGNSQEDKYPEGTVPYAIGDSANAITSRGYDVETQMQETKVSMVAVRPATQELLEELGMDTDLEFPQDRNDIGSQKNFDVRDSETVQ
jgi:formate dehydrogenase major subunit